MTGDLPLFADSAYPKRLQMSKKNTYDLISAAFNSDPHTTYANMRAAAPVYAHISPSGERIWYVTRYEDVVAILRDNERFAKNWYRTRTEAELGNIAPEPELFTYLNHHMLYQDPPNHTRLRALISSAFRPKMVRDLAPRIQAIADELLAAVQDDGEMDLIEAFAFPLSVTVIAEMLGLPPADRGLIREFSIWILKTIETSEEEAQLLSVAQGFISYLEKQFAARRQEPHDDLLTALIQAETDGDRLSTIELYRMVALLVIAGHETTVNLVANGLLALLQHPAQLARLRAEPELIDNTVEELLRYDGPIETSTARYAMHDLEFGGQQIKRGDLVRVVLTSANRDAERFVDPDELDITRDTRAHLAFGMGIHYCVGAPLARLEGRIAFQTLLARLPNLRLAGAAAELEWRPAVLVRGLERLPVAWDVDVVGL